MPKNLLKNLPYMTHSSIVVYKLFSIMLKLFVSSIVEAKYRKKGSLLNQASWLNCVIAIEEKKKLP